MTNSIWPSWISSDAVRALIIIVIAWPLIHAGARLLERTLKKHMSAQAAMLGYQLVNYGGALLLVLMVLRELGFNITTILGAAGIAGVAIGFAAQTSLSNLISGFFLIWEKPFGVDDLIKTSSTTGVVVAIDLLSTKIRTFDNTLVRIPNETLIKSEVTTITKYDIRRFDINLGVAYKEDVGRVIRVLKEVANANPFCLDEPEPLVLFLGFGDSSLNFLFGVWFAKADFLALRNSILKEVHDRFREENIEIPFPHLSIYAGSATEPFPVKVVSGQ
ncbi:MAG: mechanosensitive ion channel family protein [Kiritimatiellia bacterium]